MDKCEIFIHVAAPATIRDDRKYRSIAQSLAAFKPVTTTKLDRRWDIRPSDAFGSSLDRCPSHLFTHHAVNESTAEDARFDLGDRTEAEVCKSASGATFVNTKSALSSNASGSGFEQTRTDSSTARHNEGYAATKLCLKSDFNEPPPRTAPAVPASHLQVPASITRKRARSLSSSFSSSDAIVADSQRPTLTAPGIGERGIRSISNGLHDMEHVHNYNQSCVQGLGRSGCAKGPCTAAEKDRYVRPPNVNCGHNLESSSQPCKFFNTMMDWSSSVAAFHPRSSQNSRSSTASPLEPLTRTFYYQDSLSRPTQGFRVAKITHINLGTPTAVHTRHPGVHGVSPSLCNAKKPSLEQIASTPNSDTGSNPGASGQTCPKRQSVDPSEAYFSFPPTSSEKFTTHVSRTLKAITTKLPLSEHFRPLYVRRDIRVLERGFWQLNVLVSPEAEVMLSRTSPDKNELLHQRRMQLRSSSIWESLQNYAKVKSSYYDLCTVSKSKRSGIWTRSEFDAFWTNLKVFIRNGKAGWGVRAVKSVIDSSDLRQPDSTQLTVKVYTWGEIVGHMWLAIWVLSDKLTASVPMEWIAADQSAVVQMTGDRRRQGQLGAWIRKGPDSANGAWGVG